MASLPADWIGYWNGAPTVYVSARHKAAHYRAIADDIVARIPRADARVLDYGCGEALSSDVIAKRCGKLFLFDAADNVRTGLARAFHREANISIVDAAGLAAIPEASVDLVVVNSVVQYMSPEDLSAAIEAWKRLMTSDGGILIADIIPHDAGAVADATALLTFAGRHGFFVPAVIGLGRTFFSDYRKLRSALGLAKYSEAEMIAILARHGLKAERVHPNLGHNQGRMAFLARRA